MLLLAVLTQTCFKHSFRCVQIVCAMQRLAKQIFKYGLGMLGACACFFGQGLCIFFAVVLVEHSLHLRIVLVRQSFAQAQNDLRGAASVRGGELCFLHTLV